METLEFTIKVQLPKHLQQQLIVFQHVRQTQNLDESIGVIIQEYFRLMTPQIAQDLVAFPEIWTSNMMLRQGSLLAQLQQSVCHLNQLIQQHQEAAFLSTPATFELSSSVPLSCNEYNLQTVGLTYAVVEQGITGTKLAERLGINSSAISRKRNQSEFKQWTQVRDPYKVAWEYRVSTCRFHPVSSVLLGSIR